MVTLPSGSKTPLSIWAMSSAAVRLGGIYALHHIAQEVEEYRKRVFEILCAYIRGITTIHGYRPKTNLGGTEIKPTIEIQSILNLLFIEDSRPENL